jgi:hypothetical protein
VRSIANHGMAIQKIIIHDVKSARETVIKKEAGKEGRQHCDRYKYESCITRIRRVLREKHAEEE